MQRTVSRKKRAIGLQTWKQSSLVFTEMPGLIFRSSLQMAQSTDQGPTRL